MAAPFKRAEDAVVRFAPPAEPLQTESAFFREVYETLPLAVLVADEVGRVVMANAGARELLDAEGTTLIGRHLRGLIDAVDLQDAVEFGFLRSGASETRTERTLRGSRGEAIPVLFSASPLTSDAGVRRVVCVALDLRERRRLEVELRSAQKLEAVGRLAAGIAHEINTPVQYLGDGLHFLQGAFQDLAALLERARGLCAAVPGADGVRLTQALAEAEGQADFAYLAEQIPRALDRTLDGVSRIAGIVRAMRDFSRPAQSRRALADLNRALQNTLTVARSEYRYVAEVETDFGELPPVLCELGELNQVFLALLTNAAHAIDAARERQPDGMGRIRVRTRACEGVVEIALSDTGVGIPDDVRAHVFEPFFSTKEVGEGTGLGLAVAHAIVVERHGGHLSFESEVGRGTTFYVRLPTDVSESVRRAGPRGSHSLAYGGGA